MANVLGTLFSEIASAIRGKTGESGTMKPMDFPDKIASIITGGGGGERTMVFESGSFTPSSSDITGKTVSHGMGVVPDLIIVTPEHVPTEGCLIYSVGFSTAFHAALGGGYIAPTGYVFSGGSYMSYSNDRGHEQASRYPQYGAVQNVTTSTFKVGGSTSKLKAGANYSWYAISGIM